MFRLNAKSFEEISWFHLEWITFSTRAYSQFHLSYLRDRSPLTWHSGLIIRIDLLELNGLSIEKHSFIEQMGI